MGLVYRLKTDYLAFQMNQLRENTDASQKRRMSTRRRVLVLVLILLILPILGLTVMIARFNPNKYAPAIIAAVEQATGRQLTLGGPIRMRLSLTPVVEVNDINLSNPPGFTDPNLLTLRRVEAKIALIPLLSHRLTILRLVLENPNIILERDKAGAANWDFSRPQPGPMATAGTSSKPYNSISGYKIALQAVQIQNGQLTIKDNRGGAPTTIAFPQLVGTADSPASPLHLTAKAVLGTTPFDLNGDVGPIERFSGIGDGPWPVNLSLQIAGAHGTVHGTIAHPRSAQGYDLSVNLHVPALETVAKSLPASLVTGLTIPPVHDIDASVRIVDQNSTIPAIDNLSIKAGASNLSSVRSGLALQALDIEMVSLDQHISIHAAGMIGKSVLALTGNFGPPQALLNPAFLPSNMPPQGSFPISVSAQAGDAKIGITGAIATPAKLAGAALALNATIPDLSTLSPLAGTSLPAWKNIVVQTTLIDPGGLGLKNAVGLDGLAVTMDNAAFGGDARLYFGAQPRLQLALNASNMNVDALQAAMPPPSTPAIVPPAPATPAGRVIPNIALPIKLLKTASADVQISADTLIWNQATYTALQGHAVLAKGVLTVNPVTGQLPGGGITANAVIDATKDPAAESVRLAAPALALSPLLKAFGLPNTAQGTVQAQISATSTGDSLPAIAASLNGQLGLAMVNGIVDGAVIDRLFGNVLRTVGLAASPVDAQEPVPVRCAALRVDATNGVGTIRALTLDSSPLLLLGGGSVDFGNETLGIILHPLLKLANTKAGVPVEIGGSFEAPIISVASLSALQAAAKRPGGSPVNLTQQVLDNNSILGQLASTFGIGNGGDVCPAALKLGRLGESGPAAPPMAAAPAGTGVSAPAVNAPKNLLNSLFGK